MTRREGLRKSLRRIRKHSRETREAASHKDHYLNVKLVHGIRTSIDIFLRHTAGKETD